jgi:hypothetical protein
MILNIFLYCVCCVLISLFNIVNYLYAIWRKEGRHLERYCGYVEQKIDFSFSYIILTTILSFVPLANLVLVVYWICFRIKWLYIYASEFYDKHISDIDKKVQRLLTGEKDE